MSPTTRAALLLAVLAAAPACGDGGDGGPPDAGPTGGPQDPFPSKVCPGSDGCAAGGDGTLKAGFVAVDVTPDLAQYEGGWVDENANFVYDVGEPFDDANGNGDFDAVWIAGSQNARAAVGVHDPIWARIMVLESGDVRVGLVAYDFIGWFIDEMDDTRALLEAELQLDHVVFLSTHSHQGPDTMGLWGPSSFTTGIDPDYHARVHALTAQGLRDAVAALEPVTMTVAGTETVDNGSIEPFMSDLRDPVIVDPTLTVARFAAADDPERTVGTFVHWSAHPEYVGFDNNLLSSDYAHYLREAVEDGLGGVAVFANGTVGGQVGPWGSRPRDVDGVEVPDPGFAKAEAAGGSVGRLAVEAITSAALAEDVAAPRLAFRTGKLLVRVENTFYHVGARLGVFDRGFLGWDETQPISETNMPYVDSQVTYVEVGPVAMLTAPGELHPELFVGGYDGAYSYGIPIVAADNPNPPDLALAPPGPYLKDVMLANEGVGYPVLLGLAEDTLGYIVPLWNYELDEASPYLVEPEGDHYEETNSVGPTCEAEIVGGMKELVQWRP